MKKNIQEYYNPTGFNQRYPTDQILEGVFKFFVENKMTGTHTGEISITRSSAARNARKAIECMGFHNEWMSEERIKNIMFHAIYEKSVQVKESNYERVHYKPMMIDYFGRKLYASFFEEE